MNTPKYLVKITTYGANVERDDNERDGITGPFYNRPGRTGLEHAKNIIGDRPHVYIISRGDYGGGGGC